MDKCLYHPEREARSQCSECDGGICGECRRIWSGRLVCWKCALALSGGNTSASQPAESMMVPVTTYPNQVTEQQSSFVTPGAIDSSTLQYALGLAAGFLVMVAGTVLLEQVVFLTHYYMLSLLFIGLGYVVGACIQWLGKRQGTAEALPAVAMVVVVQLYGYVLLSTDIALKHTRGLIHRPHIHALHALPPIMWTLGPISLLTSAIVAFKAGTGDNSPANF